MGIKWCIVAMFVPPENHGPTACQVFEQRDEPGKFHSACHPCAFLWLLMAARCLLSLNSVPRCLGAMSRYRKTLNWSFRFS